MASSYLPLHPHTTVPTCGDIGERISAQLPLEDFRMFCYLYVASVYEGLCYKLLIIGTGLIVNTYEWGGGAAVELAAK